MNIYKEAIKASMRLAKSIALSGALMSFSSGVNAKVDDYEKFITKDCAALFKEAGAGDKIIDAWNSQSKNMTKILSSEMVQGMKNGTLTRKKFDELYMRPDVFYLYKLGLAIEERAAREPSEDDKKNIMMFATTLLGFKEKLPKYNLNAESILMDQKCNHHIHFVTHKTTINELYISIITDMMPYVCFADYLHHTMEGEKNEWRGYVKNFVEKNGTYPSFSPKLTTYFKIVNNILDKGVVSSEDSKKLFAEGVGFEAYFIEEAMKGGLKKSIQSGCFR